MLRTSCIRFLTDRAASKKNSRMDEFGKEVCPALFCLVFMLQAARSDIHLDVRQFGAIDLYHYHEEHCFVPQLNVSGPFKRKSVGRVITQEIPPTEMRCKLQSL